MKTRRMLAMLQVILLFLGLISSVSAAGEITPYYNNVMSVQTTASVSASGLLTIRNTYSGIQGETTKAVITTYVEKKVLGLFWSKVDLGITDDQWVDTIYNYTYNGTHSVQLESTGTYRVTATYVISGTGGAADEIEKTYEVTY